MSSKCRGRGQGKLILFGEHAVVYGAPAVASSLPLGAEATIEASEKPDWVIADEKEAMIGDEAVQKAGRLLLKEFDLEPESLAIRVRLSVPIGAGLGSSAAMAVAMARAAACFAKVPAEEQSERIFRAVSASEGVFHGRASGIDQEAAMGSGFFAFRRVDQVAQVTPLKVPRAQWLVARVAPSASTSAMVQGVSRLRDRYPERVGGLFREISALSAEGTEALKAGDWEKVGALMNINHGLLNALGVSSPILEDACVAARNAGALGAKLTGAGGGGCVIALVGDQAEPVQKALSALGDVYSFALPAVSTEPNQY